MAVNGYRSAVWLLTSFTSNTTKKLILLERVFLDDFTYYCSSTQKQAAPWLPQQPKMIFLLASGLLQKLLYKGVLEIYFMA